MNYLSPEIQAKALIANVRSATDDGPLILRLSRLIEAHEAQMRATDREEKALGEVIDQRDAAEEALSQAFYLVTGRSPEWSNLFGHAEALGEIEDACSLLRQATSPTPQAAAWRPDRRAIIKLLAARDVQVAKRMADLPNIIKTGESALPPPQSITELADAILALALGPREEEGRES
jgi:hypothetical protein